MCPDPATDHSDLEQLRKGEDQALNRLVARWSGRLLRFGLRYSQSAADAQDLVAQTFVKLYQHRHRLRPDSNLSAWLYTTLINLCRNHQRWRRRHPASSLEDDQALASARSHEADPPTSLQNAELKTALRSAIAALPHKLRTALLLFQYEDLSHREIAQILGKSEKAVESLLRRARGQLRHRLKAFIEDGEEPA